MRPLRYSINLTLDGCYDHTSISPDEELHRYSATLFERADAVLFGRVIYQMMESAWRPAMERPAWQQPFVTAINAAKKYVVSTTLEQVDWNAELVRGDLEATVRRLKSEPGKGLYTAGVTLAMQLAELGLIDEYELLVHPRIVGHGPSLFAGLSKPLDLLLTERQQLSSGAQILRYRPK